MSLAAFSLGMYPAIAVWIRGSRSRSKPSRLELMLDV